MKTVLVTGAAGFIGSNLCFRLLKESRVVGVDNFITGSRKNIRDLKKNRNFSFIEFDITKPLKVKEKIDYILNLACLASPVDYSRFPIETLLVSSLGLKNMLELAVMKKAKFLHTSTSEVYGDPLEHPQKETYYGNVNPIGERSCYDEGKRFAESLIENYRKKFGLGTSIIRIFNTYGPRMKPNDGRVVSNFIIQALSGKDLTVYGDGSQTRSFCYIDDMVRGLEAMMTSKEHGPINLGNPSEFTILELAKKILSIIKSSSRIIYKPLPKDDQRQRCPDITLAKNLLKWEPKIKLKVGLKKTIEYFKSQL